MLMPPAAPLDELPWSCLDWTQAADGRQLTRMQLVRLWCSREPLSDDVEAATPTQVMELRRWCLALTSRLEAWGELAQTRARAAWAEWRHSLPCLPPWPEPAPPPAPEEPTPRENELVLEVQAQLTVRKETPPDRAEIDSALELLGYSVHSRVARLVHRVYEQERASTAQALTEGLNDVIASTIKARRDGTRRAAASPSSRARRAAPRPPASTAKRVANGGSPRAAGTPALV